MNTFDPEKHEYRIAGRHVPSVTQVIKAAGLIDETWYTPAGTLRGTYVHEACALHDRNELDDSSVDPTIRPYLDAWVKFKAVMDVGPFSIIEQAFYSEAHSYAGTVDRGWQHMGYMFVCDIKTGELPKWLILQLAGYSILAGAFSGMGVQLRPDGNFKTQRFKTYEMTRAKHQFLEMLKHGAKNSDR